MHISGTVSSERVPALLLDAQQAADLIFRFVADRTFEQYAADVMLRSAVERQFEIVGEALNAVSRLDGAVAARLPDLPRIVAFRNILIHGYAIVDDAKVWEVVGGPLHDLRAALERLRLELKED
jgi:uncharacterized protein with HEPN domain